MEPTTQAPATPAPAAAPEVLPSTPPVEVPTFPAGTKLREYETIFALKPDLMDDAVEKMKERIRGLIHREGGKVIRVCAKQAKDWHTLVTLGHDHLWLALNPGCLKAYVVSRKGVEEIDDLWR